MSQSVELSNARAWIKVQHGTNWRNRTTGRCCIVQNTPTGQFGKVKLLHQSGRITEKQMHYFLEDFELITAVGELRPYGLGYMQGRGAS